MGMPSIPHSSASQHSLWMSKSMVRLALVQSVTCCPVSFQMSHVSTVPNSSCPRSAFCRALGTLSKIQRILVAEK